MKLVHLISFAKNKKVGDVSVSRFAQNCRSLRQQKLEQYGKPNAPLGLITFLFIITEPIIAKSRAPKGFPATFFGVAKIFQKLKSPYRESRTFCADTFLVRISYFAGFFPLALPTLFVDLKRKVRSRRVKSVKHSGSFLCI